MTPEIWEQAKGILPRAQELSGAERAAYLDEACGPNAELRREVERLLEADTDAVAFLDAGAAPGVTADRPTAQPDERIGPYRILREIGHGGMATVYLARQEGDYQRDVALKLLPRNFASPELTWRFQREIRILATLEHPHIARLYDGGETEDGQLYLGMEYIDGKPLSVYCREQQPSLEERLRLFRKICSAVHYAHRSLVVHRDIKPGNILVTVDGEPKLLDFGVAKLLSPDDDNPPTAATVGLQFLTREYASPEQLTGGAVTTASDTYSLGVVLHELLAGTRLFPSRSPAGDEKPAKPSAAVSQQVARKLRGDLDTITLMALRREPERRYGSVEQLAEDIDRYLNGLPVKAQKDTAKYRVGKFVRRHRLGVGFAALLFLTVLGFGVAMYLQQQETEKEKNRAETVAEFLETLFSASDPYSANTGDLPARELLSQGAERLMKNPGVTPDIQAQLLEKIGNILANIGDIQRAEELLQESLRVRISFFGEKAVETATSLNGLGNLYILKRDDKKAEDYLRQTLVLLPDSLSAQANLGRILRFQGKYEEAEPLLARALSGVRKESPEPTLELAVAVANMANLYQSTQRYGSALGLYEEAHGYLQHLKGKDHSQTIRVRNAIALNLGVQGRLRESEALCREVLDSKRRVLGERHNSVSATLNSLAIVLIDTGDLEEAEACAREALSISTEAFGEHHAEVARHKNTLADILKNTGRVEEAIELNRDVLKMRREILGVDHPAVANTLNNFGLLLLESEQFEEAEELLQEGIQIIRERYQDDHPLLPSLYNNLALLSQKQGEFDVAGDLFENALRVDVAFQSRPTVGAASVVRNIAKLHIETGRYEAAETRAREALKMLEGLVPAGSWRLRDCESVVGEALGGQGRYAEAEALLKESYDGLLSERGTSARPTQQALERLIRLYKEWGKSEEAEELEARAETIRKKSKE